VLRVFYPSQAEARKEEVDAEIESVNAQLEKSVSKLRKAEAELINAPKDERVFLRQTEAALEQRLTTMEVRKTELMTEKSLLEKELRTNNGRLRQFPVHIHNSVFTFLYVCSLWTVLTLDWFLVHGLQSEAEVAEAEVVDAEAEEVALKVCVFCFPRSNLGVVWSGQA
jgi:chromosome segregation ATPase